MEGSLKVWLYEPAFGRVIAAVGGLVIVVALERWAQRTFGRYVDDTDVRERKLVAFLGDALEGGREEDAP